MIRFSMGYLHYGEDLIFQPEFRFHDGRLFKYAHSLCALDHSVSLPRLRMDECANCSSQFFCEREPKEGVILVELGSFHQSRKGFEQFHASQQGVIHWICARADWDWRLFRELAGK